MAFPLSTQFLLFLWCSGVNHLVNPSSEARSGMEPEPEPEYQQQDMLPMENRPFHLPPQHYRLALPPFHVDPVQDPARRQYRLEDFLWTGSGDGPHPSEQDGGLAWEDNGGGVAGEIDSHSRSWIKVTKTMTLYRTVLTTIYPVEMTPTVISGLPIPVQPTPHLSDFPIASSTESEMVVGTDNMMWLPTPTFTPSPPEPTQTVSYDTTSVHPLEDNLLAESTDLVYWIQTSIKANDSSFRDTPEAFQRAMQKKLARVYASAFKRHLLSTLGVLSATNQSNNRKRRSSTDKDDNGTVDYSDHLVHRWLYVAQSSMSPTQLKHLATTAMNVTVSILNITAEKVIKLPRVDLQYVVLAEGSPVPAFSAVKELDLVTKKEMEEVIGYEIIDKKAEALVAGPPEQMTRNEQMVATSPWLIVAVTTICLLVILLVLIAFMVWKWKHNRLGDSNSRRVPPAPRPQSGIIEIEEGVINPAFLGTPSRIGRRGDGSLESTPKSSPALSLLSARAKKKLSEVLRSSRMGSAKGKGDEEEGKGRGKRKQKGIEASPTSSEELRLHKKSAQITSSEGSAEWKELLGEPKAKLPSRARQRSPTRHKMAAAGASSASQAKSERRDAKDMLRRRRRKTQISKLEEANLKTDEDDESEISQTSAEIDDNRTSPKPGTSEQPAWSRGSTDAISLGNLDVCQDTIAQTPSEYARKLVPWKRPGSAAPVTGSKGHHYAQSGEGPGTRRPGSRMALPETIEEIPSYDLTEEEDAKELDRDLSEKSFDMKDSPGKYRVKNGSRSPLTTPDTKDAQVQTPTRISKTTSHKARAAPKPKRSWRGSPNRAGPSESVISTESEEIVEVHHINSSMSDDQNPLGRMRKRFHQFLDDAFNVMVSGKGREDEDNPRPTRGETQSAKVSISHEVVETETEWRPWTSHVVREETLQKLRQPKPTAAVPIGPPKRAWTASSERKTQSAKSKACSEPKSSGSTAATSRIPSAVDVQGAGAGPRDGGGGADNTISDRSQSHSSMALSPAFIFPQYPAYPDIRVGSESGRPSTASSSQSQQGSQPPPPTLPSNDPSVPVIQAIKNEMRRLEKDSSCPSSSKQS